jgi:hypothetical protein
MNVNDDLEEITPLDGLEPIPQPAKSPDLYERVLASKLITPDSQPSKYFGIARQSAGRKRGTK